jgi:hypothetical protein
MKHSFKKKNTLRVTQDDTGLEKKDSHTTITNLSLTKELKIYDGEIAASSAKTAGKTG